MAKPSTAFVSKRIPLYYKLENLLREKINSGVFSPGDRLPTESDLIHQYGVSRITVRQALTALAEEGLIERRQGRGAFIAERKTKRRRFEGQTHLTGSLDEIIAMGLETPVKVLEMNRIEADTHEAELLGLQPGEPVYRIKRMRIHDGKPYSLIVNYLPAEIGARFTKDGRPLSPENFHQSVNEAIPLCVEARRLLEPPRSAGVHAQHDRRCRALPGPFGPPAAATGSSPAA